MRPSMDSKISPKIENQRANSSNSSSNTRNASNRINRVINRAVSTILPSSTNKPSHNSTNNPPPPGLSSILSRPSLTVQLNLSPKRVTGVSSSQVRENNQISGPNSRVNPILRTNLLTTTPTFKESGVISTQLTSNSRNKRVACPTGPVLHNSLPTNGHPDKGKRVISTRFTTNSVNSSQVTGKSNSASQTYTNAGPIMRTTPVLRTCLLNSPDSRFRVSKISPIMRTTPSLPGFSTKSLSLKDGLKADTISTNKSSVKAPVTDPKGKAVINSVGEPAKKYPTFKRMESANKLEKMILNNNSSFKNYKDWIKDHFISASDRDQLFEGSLDPVPVGEKCQLCSIDLAFLPFLSSSGAYTDPPVCAVLPCGHASHVVCLERVYGPTEPRCFSCISSRAKGRI